MAAEEVEITRPADGKPPVRCTIHHHYKPGSGLKEATTTMMLEGNYYKGTTIFDSNGGFAFEVKEIIEQKEELTKLEMDK